MTTMSPTLRMSFLVDCPDVCERYPNCVECWKDRLNKAGIPFRDFEGLMEEDEEHELEGSRDLVFRKYQDVLNIKTLLVLAKSGVCLYRHPVTGAGMMDIDLLAGFIQANISFSQEGVSNRPGFKVDGTEQQNGLDFMSMDQVGGLDFKEPGGEKQASEVGQGLYELNYQKFVLLVHDSAKIRSILVCDHAPSFQLKTLIITFSQLFEKIYTKELDEFVGEVSLFDEAHAAVEQVFETDLLFPYAAKLISPSEEEGLDVLEKIVYRNGYEKSQQTGFFFIATMCDELKGMLQKPTKDILHAIYELLKMEYFTPQQIETAALYMDEVKVSREHMQKEGSSVSAIYGKPQEEEIKKLNDTLKYTSEKEAKALFKQYFSNANSRLELGIYEDAIKNFDLAKTVAIQVGLTKELEIVDAKIEELNDTIQTLEYTNAMRIAVTAEKNKDFLKAVQYYTSCKKILDKFKDERNEKRVKEIDRRISNLQGKIR